ncbi:DNA-binding transcriptional LysR family regulator [Tahibacter aquaticus]|uniref:DNA-binding transcriptional LysR family regulator n=1 Tax=Tahibacter aquaticus TaxID=520092 RepID=A0A4R6Z4I9_9GAMM|nr:LysR substrate-binding domain-containing protein [Tahibacter aquaticus]TDR46585.1 DNA-binding transcriptional LysR family regulator [Tahibacter aquaticus]
MILDLAALQTLVAAIDLNGFGKAAEHLHRTPGAVSQQLKALEEKVGAPLFRKVGRQQVPTDAGEVLLAFARRLLQLNDEAALALRGLHLDGEVRFGMPQDFADSGLPQTLATFARAHAAVRIDISVDRSATLQTQLARGALDLVLAFGESADPTPPLARLPVRWFAHPEFTLQRGQPVPLLLLGNPCAFRQAAIDALDKARRPWRIALSSGSVSAIWAAAAAGLGVTARADVHIPDGLTCVDKAFKLPRLGNIALQLSQNRSRTNAAADHLRELVQEAVRSRLG